MPNIPHEKVISMALKTGATMLNNGAETYRVEETIEKMIASKYPYPVDVLAISTGIIISTNVNEKPYTIMERVTTRSINLGVISKANSFARKFTSEDISLEEATELFNALTHPVNFKTPTRLFFSGMAGGFFVLLFGGTIPEFIMAYLASSMIVAFMDSLEKHKLNFFIKHLLGGMALALMGFILVSLGLLVEVSADYGKVIIGPLMTLVPGVPLTNGIRDLVSGELIAGSAKIAEALFIAVGLAFGVGMALQGVAFL